MTIYSFSRKTMNTRENFWNVYCFATNQMRDETAKDNGQTAAGISYDFIDTKQWAGFFFYEKSSIFPLYLSIFYHKPTLVTFPTNQCWISKTKLPNWPKSECKLWKFTTVQVRVMVKVSQPQRNKHRGTLLVIGSFFLAFTLTLEWNFW